MSTDFQDLFAGVKGALGDVLGGARPRRQTTDQPSYYEQYFSQLGGGPFGAATPDVTYGATPGQQGGPNFGVTLGADPFGGAFGQWQQGAMDQALFAKQRREAARDAAASARSGTAVEATGGASDDAEVSPYWSDIEAAAKEYNVSPDRLAAIMKVESHGKRDARSPAGAMGLMQVMPNWFQAGEDPFDARTNIRAGARVLAGYLKQYNGDVDMATRAYHGFGSDGNTDDRQYLSIVQQQEQGIKAGRQRAAPAGDGTAPVPSFTGDYQLHWGSDPGATDIMMPEGTPVVSIGAGTVVDSSVNSVGGNSVTIRLDNGLTVYMAHFRDASPLRAGQRVAPGSFVGYVGQTGNAAGTGAHLHIGIGPTIVSGTGARGGAGAYANGQPFDAVGYLRGLRRGATQTQQRGRPS